MRKLLLFNIGLLTSLSMYAQAELPKNEEFTLVSDLQTTVFPEAEIKAEPVNKKASVQIVSCHNNNYVLLFSNHFGHCLSLKILNDKKEPLDEFLDNLHVVNTHRIELNGAKMPVGKYIIAFESSLETVHQEIEIK